jgi:hypothetical protein
VISLSLSINCMSLIAFSWALNPCSLSYLNGLMSAESFFTGGGVIDLHIRNWRHTCSRAC